MSNRAEQIKALYEISGCTPEQIAEVESLEVGAVKALLVQSSGKYREDVKSAKENDFTESDNDLSLAVIRRVAQYSGIATRPRPQGEVRAGRRVSPRTISRWLAISGIQQTTTVNRRFTAVNSNHLWLG